VAFGFLEAGDLVFFKRCGKALHRYILAEVAERCLV